MVKNLSFLFSAFFMHFFSQMLFAEIITVNVPSNTILEWKMYSDLKPQDTLNIVTNPFGEITIYEKESIVISNTILCNAKLKIKSENSRIIHNATLKAPSVILEAVNISLKSSSIIDTSSSDGGGNIYIGGGWQGNDPTINNAKIITMDEGAEIITDALTKGNAGTVVLFSEISTCFNGQIFARAKGLSGSGGDVEVSSSNHLIFNGNVDLSSKNGSSGHLLLDPTSITINAAGPDINGNGGGLDITFVNQLNNALTTPAGFPNANSIITAGALNALLTNNVSLTLAAQNFITVNSAISTANLNVTLTFSAPTVNLNSSITLGAGGVLAGSGATTVNVGASGVPQNAIDIVAPSGTINLATATYTAPLTILNKNLILNGNGQANTTILVTGAVPSHSSRNPAIYVEGGTNVTVQNLKVDCNNVGFPTNGNITGIFYFNAGGTISNTHITQVANTPPPYGGGQQGNAIRAAGNLGGPFTLTINGNTIDHFQKAGIVVFGSLLTSTITNNIVTGVGISTPAAIGIQMSDGSSIISGNTISNIIFTDHSQSDGLLIFSTSSSGVTVSSNTISNCDEAILTQNTDGITIQNNLIQNNGDSGIIILDTLGPVDILSNTITNNGGLGSNNFGMYLLSTTTQTFNVSNNTLIPAPGTFGVFTQGNSAGNAPNASFLNNIFVDP